ncbi:hypothetical protein [Paenibacillus anseongense]|nr:hypothetical protein [Paenibacillus anseongense]MEC0266435.1 hypothetical protein [Paenibacillus anseongense]
MKSNAGSNDVMETAVNWRTHWILSNEIADFTAKVERSLEFVQ